LDIAPPLGNTVPPVGVIFRCLQPIDGFFAYIISHSNAHGKKLIIRIEKVLIGPAWAVFGVPEDRCEHARFFSYLWFT
jgi:hypothetical protein